VLRIAVQYLSLMVGVVSVFAGVLLGYWLGRRSVLTEGSLLRERIGGLEAEIEAQRRSANLLQEHVTRLTGELGTAEANFSAEKAKAAEMELRIERAFGDLAAKALSANNQSFLALAQEKLGAQSAEARRDLAEKELAIKNLVDPLDAALKNLDGQARAMEEKRAGSYAEVKALVETMQQSIPASLDALKSETVQLISALRAPKTRGNWGELQLKRCVEYAGMLAYCSFSEQVSARDDDDKLLRPDMTIKLPNDREIVVDAKTPLDAFLDAGNVDPAAQKLRFEAHAKRVREHMKDLDKKRYWEQFSKAPDFVVCFLPSEALFSAALEADPSLIEFSAQHRVVLATPTTLIALLRAVEFGWQQMEITKNAKAIHEAGRKIYEKLVIAQGYVQQLGNALARGVDYYNKFLGTIEGKGGVFFHGRQLGDLVHSDDELAEIKTLPPGAREMESGEWAQPLFAVAASESEEQE
jgi:DNA recombination protein RmuC